MSKFIGMRCAKEVQWRRVADRRQGLLSSVFLATFMFSPAYASATDEPPIGIILAAGDISKCGPPGADEKTAGILVREIAKAKSANIQIAILALGDLAYDSGSEADFKCYDKSWGQQDIYRLTLPVPGNHEYETGNAKPFFRYFSKLPIVAASTKRGGYYVMDVPTEGKAAWRIYALNSYAGVGKSSPQIKWLANDLSETKAPCILAFWHPFIFSSGHHGHAHSSKADAPFVRGNSMVAAFQVLKEAGATVVLSGHDHDFEQFGRHDANGSADSDGLRSFVVGTGGGPLYKNVLYAKRPPTSEVYRQDTHGVLKLELYSGSYRWSFLEIDGDKPITLSPNEDRCRFRS
ncbi:alkaline phosphatase [Rhizobium leguminosarum]|uniref:metallophosphoesterase family protein n=1 Tax=Rhizobium leguminosarum TaxID=384 RepID=UPI001C924F40|nr:metallophosphoesterase [Rhizobium leguminosarum]MBY3030578.1 alkaline phosphatase [Rhizobium leguminosarum]